MIKPIISLSIFLLASVTGEAMAVGCIASTGYARVTALNNLLQDKTVCGQVNSDEWQEYHKPGGDLWDYKKGPDDHVDPSTLVGTWEILSSTRGDSVSYNYGADDYIYKVWQRADGKYDFCNGTQLKVASAELRAGQVSCH